MSTTLAKTAASTIPVGPTDVITDSTPTSGPASASLVLTGTSVLKGAASLSMSLGSKARAAAHLAPFSSVSLSSANLKILVSPAAAGMFAIGFGTSTDILAFWDVAALQHSALAYAVPGIPLVLECRLPSDHSFGRVLKGASIDRPCPVVHTASLESGVSATDIAAAIVVTISVDCSDPAPNLRLF